MTTSYQTCPYCESEISITARKCRYCGEWMPNADQEAPSQLQDSAPAANVQPLDHKESSAYNLEQDLSNNGNIPCALFTPRPVFAFGYKLMNVSVLINIIVYIIILIAPDLIALTYIGLFTFLAFNVGYFIVCYCSFGPVLGIPLSIILHPLSWLALALLAQDHNTIEAYGIGSALFLIWIVIILQAAVKRLRSSGYKCGLLSCTRNPANQLAKPTPGAAKPSP